MEDREATGGAAEANIPADAVQQVSPVEGSAGSDSAPMTIGDALGLSVTEKKAVLKARAQRLARKPDEEVGEAENLDVIEFRLAHERYAVEVRYVREVSPLRDLTPVPCTPSYVLGIMNVRGQVMSVTDAREFFDLPKKEINPLFRVLILENHSMEMGVLADEVVGETKIPLADIQGQMPSMGRIKEEYVRGVTKDRLIVLNADKLLSDPSLVIHQEVGD